MSYTTIQLRRGTAAQWTASNPTLELGEFGYETDTNWGKFGNGTDAWNDLPYAYSTPSQIYNASDYGVTADGTSDDRAAINSLISTVSSAGGGVVLLPAGTIKVTGSISLASNVTVRGHGWATVVKLFANIPGDGVFTIGSGVSDVVIEDLKIDGNSGTYSQTNWGIYGKAPGNYSDITVRNVWVHSMGYVGIGFLGSTTRATTTKNIRVVDCKVTNSGGHGILAQDGVDQVFVSHNTVVGHGLLVADNIGICAGRGGYDLVVTGNTIDSTGGTGSSSHGISLDTVLGRVVCSSNTVSNGVAYGIEAAGVVNGSIVGNTITAPGRVGIALTSLGAADDRENGSNSYLSVADNVIDGQDTTISGIGISMGSTASSQDIPASSTIVRNTAYTAAATTRVYEGRRLYECTTSGTTHASVKPATWGSTRLGNTITDGTSVWTDRGTVNSQIAISSNVVSKVTTIGINVARGQDISVCGNHVTQCGQSGIYVASTANMYTITDNTLQGNNSTNTGGHANLYISSYTGIGHVARIFGNRMVNGGIANQIAQDSLSGNRMDDRFLANSTSPDVAFGTTFFTQNSTATTIASLLNANTVEGRIVNIRVNDAYTTFQHSSSGANTLRLLTASNYAAPSGANLTFFYNSSLEQWVEIARSTGTPASSLQATSVTAIGGASTENGANTWAKLTTITSTGAYDTLNMVMAVTCSVKNGTGADTALVSVHFSNNNTSTSPNLVVDFIAKGGTGSLLAADSFKLISDGWGNPAELWVKKADTYGSISAFEISRASGFGGVVSHNGTPSWQSATPTGSAVNASSSGVTIFGKPASVKVSVPANSTTAGRPGQWAADANYHYSYTGDGSTHSWVRSAAATW